MPNRLVERMLAREDIFGLFLILVLLVGVFSPSLWFAPTSLDDIKILSSVARIESPLAYFTGDWGLGSGYYRPLHSATSWLLYRIFGVWAFPSQLINLLLHLVNVWLLFRIIGRVQPNRTISLLAVSLSVVSIYTLSPASWVSDRPTLLVALCLLLLLDRFSRNQSQIVSPWYVALLSSLALMSKQSGLIVPLFALYGSRNYSLRLRLKIAIACFAVILVYATVSIVIFGPNAAGPAFNGYLFGIYYYENWSQLPAHSKLIASVGNVFKNFIAVFLPVFTDEGGILPISRLLSRGPLWLPTLLISMLSYSPRLSGTQKSAIVLIILNSLVHFGLFRYRIHYIPQLAFSLFIASSPHLLYSWSSSIAWALRSKATVFSLLAAILLLFSVLWVGRSLSNDMVGRREYLLEIPMVAERDPSIDKDVVEQIISRYGAPAWATDR